MSSKLVKKLLNQTNTQLESDDAEDYHHQTGSGSRTRATQKITREEAIQGHIDSILRLDSLVQEHTSTSAQKSFARRSTLLKLQAKKQRKLKKLGIAGSSSNSRSSSSSFSKQQQQPTFNKDKAKRKKEEDYYLDIARALKKAKKKNNK